MTTGSTAARGLLPRQTLVLLLLFGGYAACYFGRANFSVSMPLLVDELARHGLAPERAVVQLGTVYSMGVLAYALGKLCLGGLGDWWGGRRSFLIALGGSALFTFLFSTGAGLPLFTLAWVGNRLTQSIGWAGLLKVTGRWFDFRGHGTVVALLSVSYLVGDALARESMGLLLAHGASWMDLSRFAAAVLGGFFLLNLVFLRESRVDCGYAAPQVNPLNLYGHHVTDAPPLTVRGLLLPLLASRSFRLVCVLSFGCTVVREAFGVWLPVFLKEAAGYDAAHAARFSGVFPAVGAVSVLMAGWAGDRLGVNGRPTLLFVGLWATAVALGALFIFAPAVVGRATTVALIGLVAFCLLGPYSYLGGAFALDFGGGRGGAIASGLIDGVGYLGGALAGIGVAQLSVAYGWRGVFAGLSLVAVLSALAAGWLYTAQRQAHRQAREELYVE
jgi:OPA family glycerol-3-phosphate transporter-like MFS transporter